MHPRCTFLPRWSGQICNIEHLAPFPPDQFPIPRLWARTRPGGDQRRCKENRRWRSPSAFPVSLTRHSKLPRAAAVTDREARQRADDRHARVPGGTESDSYPWVPFTYRQSAYESSRYSPGPPHSTCSAEPAPTRQGYDVTC